MSNTDSFHLLSSSENGLILKWATEKCPHLDEFDAREPFVVFILQRSEELRLYDLF